MQDHARTAHATEGRLVARALDVDIATGLAESEAARRLLELGGNVLPAGSRRGLGQMLRDQLVNVIALLLGAAAVLSWFSGDVLQALAIVIVLVLNAAVGIATEWQSGRALEALRNEMRATATVRRGGVARTIDAASLVVGDIILLGAGDRVTADLRLLEAAALCSEESALTGESATVAKSVERVSHQAPVAERASMLYLGTMIASGRGVGIVVATGADTELGRIGRLVNAMESEPTALQRRLEQLGHRLVYLVLVIGALVTISGWLRGEPLVEMMEVGLSLAVAAVPEALPAVTTFILAFGVLRMARHNAIVRRLSAVETLGSTTVICSDKTGTLTMNEMTVTELRLGSGGVADPIAARELLQFAALCSEATRYQGDPTEVAIVAAAEKAGLDVDALRRAHPRLSEEPFDAVTRRMTTEHRDFTIIKGAPSVIVDACRYSAEETGRLLAVNDGMARRGLRVLAVAAKRLGGRFSFAGFIGMSDPPRPGVIEAVAAARTAGIRVVMLTGDQLETARAIARELGIGDRVRHAREVEGLPSGELPLVVENTDAFARVAPEEKYRIVEALQQSGEIVAVTGDGINDAPALKKADVGVAMGRRGTEVAKEAADIVLTDDNFATIVSAIEGGRAIYANIRKFVQMMFSHNLNEVLTIFVALLLGWPLPLLPLQILWLNLATDVFPAFALALEPGSPGAMRRPPRDPREPLFSSALIVLILWQAAMLATVSLTIYAWALHVYGPGAHSRTVALLALIGTQVGHMFNCRSRTRSLFDGAFTNPHVWFAAITVIALQIGVFATPYLSRLLDLASPNRIDVAAALAAIVLPILVVEVMKSVARRRRAAMNV